jgi:hypothetical protein
VVDGKINGEDNSTPKNFKKNKSELQNDGRTHKGGFEYGDKVDQVLGARIIQGDLNLFCSW